MCGIVLAFLVDLLIIGTTYACIQHGLLYISSEELLAVYITVAGFSLLSHISCCISNPGVLPKEQSLDTYLLNSTSRVCDHCEYPKPQRVHHCATCQKCVLLKHHHCPWINNCVALYTQKNYILFLVYTFLGCLLTLAIMIAKSVVFGVAGDSQGEFCITVGVIVISSIFAVRLGCLMFDQCKYLWSNNGPIDDLLLTTFRRRKFSVNFYEVFGSNWMIWAVPVIPQVQIAAIEEIN